MYIYIYTHGCGHNLVSSTLLFILGLIFAQKRTSALTCKGRSQSLWQLWTPRIKHCCTVYAQYIKQFSCCLINFKPVSFKDLKKPWHMSSDFMYTHKFHRKTLLLCEHSNCWVQFTSSTYGIRTSLGVSLQGFKWGKALSIRVLISIKQEHYDIYSACIRVICFEKVANIAI
jgi:hypothetical protein